MPRRLQAHILLRSEVTGLLLSKRQVSRPNLPFTEYLYFAVVQIPCCKEFSRNVRLEIPILRRLWVRLRLVKSVSRKGFKPAMDVVHLGYFSWSSWPRTSSGRRLSWYDDFLLHTIINSPFCVIFKTQTVSRPSVSIGDTRTNPSQAQGHYSRISMRTISSFHP